MSSLVVAALAFAFQSPAAEPPSSFPEHFLAGEAALESGDVAGAKALFERCLALLPGNANATYELACAQARAGERDASLATLERAVAAGFDDAALARWDPDLESVRGDARFAAALARIPEASAPAVGWDLIRSWNESSPCFSADGSTLAFGRAGNGFLLDVESNSLVSVLPKSLRGIAGASYSPDGRFIVTPIDEDRILVWNGRTGELLHELHAPRSWQGRIHWCESEPWFIASGVIPDSSAWIWNAETGEQVAFFERSNAGSWISPDGARAATMNAPHEFSVLQVMDVAAQKSIAEHNGFGPPRFDGGFSADGKRLWILPEEGGAISIFDALTGEEEHLIRGHDSNLTRAILLGRKSVIVAANAQGRLDWMEFPSGKVLRAIEAGLKTRTLLEASPDETLVLTSAWGESIRMRDADTGEELWSLSSNASWSWISSAAFSPDSRHVLLPLEGRFHVYDAKTGGLERVLGNPWLRPTAPAFDQAGERMAFGCPDGSVRLVDLALARPLIEFAASKTPIEQCLWLADGSRILTLDRERQLRLWDASEGKLVAEVGSAAAATRYPSFALAVASPDGRRVLLYGPAMEGFVIDPRDGARLFALEPAAGDPWRVAWSRDGQRIAMAAKNGSVCVWEAGSGKRLPLAASLADYSLSLDFSPDGRLLAAGSGSGWIKVWRIADGALVREYHHLDAFDTERDIRNLCFSPDSGSVLYSTGDFGTVVRFDVASGAELWRWESSGGNGGAIQVAFDASGQRAIFGGMLIGQTHVVDAATGKDLADLEPLDLFSLEQTPGGRFLIGSHRDGLVVLDGRSLKHLYTYTPFENGGWLAATPTLACDGTLDAIRAAWLATGTSSWPLDSFGAVLVDRKRVRAAAAGVELAWPKLGTPPTLTIENNAGRIVHTSAGQPEVEITFADPNGIAGLEVDIGAPGSSLRNHPIPPMPDGEHLTHAGVTLAGDDTQAQTSALARAVGVSGLLSRIVRVTFVRNEAAKR